MSQLQEEREQTEKHKKESLAMVPPAFLSASGNFLQKSRNFAAWKKLSGSPVWT